METNTVHNRKNLFKENIFGHQKIPLLVDGSFSGYGHQPIPLNIMNFTGGTPVLSMMKSNRNDKESRATGKYLIIHLKKMTQVTGKFRFLQPDEELLIWYGLLVSVLWNHYLMVHTCLVIFVSCQSSSQATTILFCNFELLFIHCRNITV